MIQVSMAHCCTCDRNMFPERFPFFKCTHVGYCNFCVDHAPVITTGPSSHNLLHPTLRRMEDELDENRKVALERVVEELQLMRSNIDGLLVYIGIILDDK